MKKHETKLTMHQGVDGPMKSTWVSSPTGKWKPDAGGKKTGRRPLNYAGCSSWKCIAATLCKCPTHVQHFRRHSFSPSVSLQQRSTKFTQLPWCIIYDASRNQLSSTSDVKSKQAGRTHLFFTRWHVSTTTGEPSAGSTCASLVKGLE